MINAINEALIEEMERDSKVIIFGEDVRMSLFGDTKGLLKRFGPERVRDTPVCEQLITGMAVGAAAAGYRVVCHLLYGNFLYTGFDAVANQAAKLRLMTGGQTKLPIVFVAATGGGRSVAAQHSDSVHPYVMNLGGIKVVTPSTPADGKGLLKTAIRDDNPVAFLQSAGRGGESGDVPDGDCLVPFGQGVIRRSGSDVTIVAFGGMLRLALKAAEVSQERGIDVEVVDPRTLVPLDTKTIVASVKKTGRLVIVDEARDCCSAASHIAAVVADEGFHHLRAPVKRVTVNNLAIPYSPPLEQAALPSVERIVESIESVFAEISKSL
jgi:pyruvate dehydrogenase E1 component beta subunit